MEEPMNLKPSADLFLVSEQEHNPILTRKSDEFEAKQEVISLKINPTSKILVVPKPLGFVALLGL